MKKGTALALGLFDSIHIGHRYLVKTAQEYAKNNSLDFLLLTFDDNFYQFINKKEKALYTLAERKVLLRTLGINYYVITSTKQFFSLDAQGFYNYLTQFSPQALFMGQDYSFGAKGKWHPADMQEYYKDKDTVVFVVDLLELDSQKVSSSLIKSFLTQGNLAAANMLLGNEFFIIGKVVPGKRIGRTMGIPTANLESNDNKFLPKWGVYAARAEIEGEQYKGIVNVGSQPTFCCEKPCVEVHLLEFNKHIYGKELKLSFKERIRDIVTFDSPQALRAQIESDIKKVESLW